jgi:hypothetical protein
MPKHKPNKKTRERRAKQAAADATGGTEEQKTTAPSNSTFSQSSLVNNHLKEIKQALQKERTGGAIKNEQPADYLLSLFDKYDAHHTPKRPFETQDNEQTKKKEERNSS